MQTQQSFLTPKELVLKHIFDKNHVVTEDEFKNVRVGFATNATEEKLFTEELSEFNPAYEAGS